jgi:hypothetical protein
MKPTFEQVATLLCKGVVAPDWVIERLRQNAGLVGYHKKLDDDDSLERLLFESALHLDDWLSMYYRIEKRFGIEMPECIDQHEPYSEKLWEACEAYWQACDHPETSAVSRLRNWERYLLELSPP